MGRGHFVFLSLALLASLGASSAQAAPAATAEQVQGFLGRHCTACHSDAAKMAGLSLELADLHKAPAHVWDGAASRLQKGLMPPPGTPKPDEAERDAVIAWMREQVDRAAGQDVDPGRVTVRRLNRAEYNNTVRDLLGVHFQPADDFPPDDTGYGFDTIGDVLSVSPLLTERYLRAAEQIANRVIDLRPAPEPTVEQYVADGEEQYRRTDPDDPLGYPFNPGDFQARHFFPVDAEYDLFLRLKDSRSGEAKKVSPSLTLFLDGKRLDSWIIEDGEYGDGYLGVRLPVQAGWHTIYAEFDPSYVNKETRDYYKENEKVLTRRLFVERIDVGGPFDYDPRAQSAWNKLFVCDQPTRDCAAEILSTLARRAYRRPPTEQEVSELVALVDAAQARGDSFEAGVQLALKAVLISPNFLFRVERDPEPGQVRRLNDFELASRLSYFVWSSMPDDELLAAAEQGKLADAAGVEAQVRRMLADERASALVHNFGGQWLQLRKLDEAQPAAEQFPTFHDYLRQAMRQETELFFETILREDRSIVEFIDADWTFVNNQLAALYGIQGVKGHRMRKVQLDGHIRGGVLTQASVLTVSSYPTRTSPVLRGLWVLENLLGAPPPPPPADVPPIDESKIGPEMSVRRQFEIHRANPSCSVCHVAMDPIGFSLENFDAIGRWRAEDGGRPVDASGELPDGRKFDGPIALKGILLQDKAELARTLSEKMLTYALGRGLRRDDALAVKQVGDAVVADDYRFSRLIVEIAKSPLFTMRRAEGAGS
ncbi:MAG: DUF1592 domain-containing protein [Acidobacteria bacterium]|nr:DUF1592 domain-containing protein [Acidobacteriota bacterium]